jgi:hypothetical protein
MTSFLINPYRFGAAYDTDAQAYITAVETADGQALETGVRDAINAFVVGCKADGIWTAIKASCILAGARTLAGALVPLRGTAPTNNNFVSGDYNRETGLIGDGSTKYLNTSYAVPSGDASNHHFAAYTSTIPTANTLLGASQGTTIRHLLYKGTSGGLGYLFCLAGNTFLSFPGQITLATGFSGFSRASSSSYTARHNGTDYSTTTAVAGTTGLSVYTYAENSSGSAATHSNARIQFYSIGQALSLSALDARLSTLLTAYAAAIP